MAARGGALFVWTCLVAFAAVAGACGESAADPSNPPSGADGIDGGADDGEPDAGATPVSGPIVGEVRRYDYTFDLVSRRATSKLSIDVAAPGGDCLAIGCRTPAAEQTTWNGAPPVSSTLAGGALELCGSPIAAGTIEIAATTPSVPSLTFHGLDIGFSQRPDRADGQFSYLLSWVGNCDRFGPCDPDPSRLAEMSFQVTHPEGTVVLCPGKLTPGATTTRCDVAGTLAPTYSGFALAADPLWKRAPFTSAAGVDLVMYEVPGGKIASSLDAASVREFLVWITALLGPMPYGPELRVAGAPTRWLGFEHPANILLQEDLPDLSTGYADTTMHVLMHEIVHQWSGDRTTLASASDFVWKEAIAEYLAYVFEDEHRTAGEAAASRAYWDAISLQARHRPRPTDNPSVESFYGDVYGPGPMVLFVQLEPMIGRAAILAAIKAFLAEPGAKSVNDLRGALEKASSKDLKKYFDAWVTGAGEPEWPTFAVSFDEVGDQLTVTVTQQNASGVLYGCKVEVAIAGPSATARATVDFGLAPTSATASTTITFAGARTSVRLDPDHKVIGRAVGASNGFAAPASLPVWIF